MRKSSHLHIQNKQAKMQRTQPLNRQNQKLQTTKARKKAFFKEKVKKSQNLTPYVFSREKKYILSNTILTASFVQKDLCIFDAMKELILFNFLYT